MLRFVDDLISIKARKYIRTLATKQSSDPGGRILRIIRVCPHIVSVALWALQFSDNFKDIEIPSLRRFTFHAYSRSLSFLCPFFASITHLELAGPDAGEWDAFFDAGLSDAPSLTHLVLSIKHNDEDFQHFLGIITPYISARLQLLLLLMDEHHAAGSVWHPNSYDIRLVPAFSEEPDWDTTDPVANILVVDVFTGGFEVWTGNVPEEETFWARGMKVVEERRKTLTYTETKVD
ncbi:hypothetical protein DL96DRAFT_1600123 [Flagelloscypha sp. PMI_526]|nr:hypothetical protein DL96DRAFT_1600123 [Flagelloscypha sp. PMI_526]